MEFPPGPVCQSCGMPLKTAEDCGTENDGSRSRDYCFHCFQRGGFLDEGITLQEKIEKNVQFGIRMGMPEDSARHLCETILRRLELLAAEITRILHSSMECSHILTVSRPVCSPWTGCSS